MLVNVLKFQAYFSSYVWTKLPLKRKGFLLLLLFFLNYKIWTFHDKKIMVGMFGECGHFCLFPFHSRKFFITTQHPRRLRNWKVWEGCFLHCVTCWKVWLGHKLLGNDFHLDLILLFFQVLCLDSDKML